ncbi:hypothetical protein ACWZJV_21040 [Nocardioides sp. WG-D5]
MRIVDTAGGRPVEVLRVGAIGVWVMDSVAFGGPEHAGQVIVTGSHGGRSAGEYAASYGVAVMVANDAGVGKNAAGIAGLSALDALDIAGIGVSHETARIGDGADTWESGVVSYVNARAESLGARVGEPLRAVVARLLDKEVL